VIPLLLEEAVDAMRGIVDALGPLGLFVAMIIQAVIAPIPSDLLVISAVAFGMDPVFAIVAAATGSTVGGVLAFYISRRGGKRFARRMVGEKNILRLERWFARYGDYIVVFGRATPLISSDAISYVAGFTGISVQRFIPLALVGAFIRASILITVGQALVAFIPFLG
jgi:uncharacterized membrane protein YdjX (TVP38/TMEM64 family)